MKIIYQDQELELEQELSLAAFVKAQGLEEKGIAAAVNDEIVPKREWSEFRLKEGMRVDIFNLVAGG